LNTHPHKTYSRREALRLSLSGALATAGAVRAVAASTNAPAAATPAPPIETGEPPVKARMFWTWDHSTEWLLNCPGAQTYGSCNYYSRTKECFEGDYTRLLEFCGRQHIDAVIVWGLLRDHHGGVESAKRLAEVAAKNGVRLLCGVGLCAYGGVYYEGDSPYSLDLRLQQHPELKAFRASGDPLEFSVPVFGEKKFFHACPSRKDNQEYLAESLQWLFKNVPLDGVQIEAGDTGVCQCKLCRERRRYPSGKFSWEDLALLHPIAIRAIRDVKPAAWICCETYSHPEPHHGEEHPEFGGGKTAWADECLAKLPDGVFIQWVYDMLSLRSPKQAWTQAGNLDNKRHRHILRAHFSTYWNGTRGELAIEEIAKMVQESTARGADTMTLFGEVSRFQTGAELNYVALENFGSAANPKAELDRFLREVAGPLLGGEAYAHAFLKYADLKKEPHKIPQALKDIYGRCGLLPPEAARRWAWLGNFLASCAFQNR
jgi:hypothetical protein